MWQAEKICEAQSCFSERVLGEEARKGDMSIVGRVGGGIFGGFVRVVIVVCGGDEVWCWGKARFGGGVL